MLIAKAMKGLVTKEGKYNYDGGFYCKGFIQLTANDDLNDKTDYTYAYRWDAGTYPKNSPIHGCTMYVLRTNWGHLQIAIFYHREIQIYLRHFFVGEWGAWKQLI